MCSTVSSSLRFFLIRLNTQFKTGFEYFIIIVHLSCVEVERNSNRQDTHVTLNVFHFQIKQNSNESKDNLMEPVEMVWLEAVCVMNDLQNLRKMNFT